jgi:prepilin-type N-terminal cleavage/methylation domain-containing protein
LRSLDRRRSAESRGFTLVEFLMALVLTAIIGATVVSMIFGVTRGTKDGDLIGQRNAQLDVASSRLNGQIRAAGRILAIGDGVLVLWIADSHVNNQPNLSELRRIEFNAASGEIRCYAAPDNLSAAADTIYDESNDFLAITDALKGTANFPYQTIALHVTGWSISTSTFSSTTRCISYKLTLTDGSATFDARSNVAMHGEIDTSS